MKSKIINSENDKKQKTMNKDIFSEYLKQQCSKTTVNGQKIKAFSWYQKILGLK